MFLKFQLSRSIKTAIFFLVLIYYVSLNVLGNYFARYSISAWAHAEQNEILQDNLLSAAVKLQALVGGLGSVSGLTIKKTIDEKIIDVYSVGKVVPDVGLQSFFYPMGFDSGVSTVEFREYGFTITYVYRSIALDLGLSVALIFGIFSLIYVDSERKKLERRVAIESEKNILRSLQIAIGEHPVESDDLKFEKVYKDTRDLYNRNLKLSVMAEIGTLASQVAHDIRSPLSALNMVTSTLSQIPEDKRVLIRSAINRINDIANSLLEKGKVKPSDIESASRQPLARQELLAPLIEMLVSEKRIQYRESSRIDIQTDLSKSYGLFAKVDANELKRVLSNLINNSVEALEGGGHIVVSVVSDKNNITIAVRDDGKGIAPEVLAKIGQRGFSHGKSSQNNSGSGLGVHHALATIESFGGSMKIESKLGSGTTVIIQLPKAETPDWFIEKIELAEKTVLVSLDDDISIHQIWKGRLQSIDKSVEFLSFTSAQEFIDWYNSSGRRALFLIDYELLNQSRTGLDVIEELGIQTRSILVTSRYEETSVRERCARLKVKLIPKSMAGFVPIEVQKPREKYDLVFLDDDDLIHMSWNMSAKERSHKIKGFKTQEDFLAELGSIDMSTPIYIDANLGENSRGEKIRGEDIAEIVAAKGFKNIFISTGYDSDSIALSAAIVAVVSKDYPKITTRG